MNDFPQEHVLILPSKLAVVREQQRMLTNSPTGVVLKPRINHFGRLENDLSGSESGMISELGREMMLERLVRAEAAAFGCQSNRIGSGLIGQVGALIEQLKSGEIFPHDFQRLADGIMPPQRREALTRIYNEYETYLNSNGYTDRAGNRLRILTELKKGRIPRRFRNIRGIIIRDFSRLTPFQIELIKSLIHWKRPIHLSLPCPDWIFGFDLVTDTGPSMNPFRESLQMIESFESMGDQGLGLELSFPRPGGDEPRLPALAHLTRNLFRPDPPDDAPDPKEALEIWAAPGRYAEVEEIGRGINALLDQGVAPSTIAVSVRDMGAYGYLFEDVFRRFKLPMSFRRGETLAVQAPVRALLALLRLAASHWERELVLDVLASPYLDLELSIPWPRAAELSARANVTDERAGGGWSRNLLRLAEKDKRVADDCRGLVEGIEKLKEYLAPLSLPLTWPDFIDRVLDVLKIMKLANRIRGEGGIFSHRDLAAWAKLMECLEELRTAVAEAGLDREMLAPEILEQGVVRAVKDKNIGGSESGGHGIMVLNVNDLHGLEFDYLFMAGLNEGEFPRPKPEGLLLDESGINALNRAARRNVLRTVTAEYRQEELVFYHAMSAVRRRAVLSFCGVDEKGRLRLPSALVDEVLRLWPEDKGLIVREIEPRATPTLDRALTREEIVGGLSQNIFQANEDQDQVLTGEVWASLMERPPERDRWESVRNRIQSERIGDRTAAEEPWPGIPPETARLWLADRRTYQGSPLLEPTLLQEYAQCPFAFWARRIIGLEEIEEAGDEVSALHEGSILHQILFRFLCGRRDEHKLPLNGSPEEREALRTAAELEWAHAEKAYPLGRQPLWRIKRRQMERVLTRWLEKETAAQGEFIPTYFEWIFGPQRGGRIPDAPPLEIPLLSGDRLFVQGRVDRIDVGPEQCLVLDYKNSSNTARYSKMLQPGEMGVTSFQAPLYQVAAARHLGISARAAWVLLQDFKGTRSGPRPSPSTDTDFFTLDPDKRREMVDLGQPGFFDRLEQTWLRLTGGDFQPDPEHGLCDYCEFNLACRSGDDDPNRL